MLIARRNEMRDRQFEASFKPTHCQVCGIQTFYRLTTCSDCINWAALEMESVFEEFGWDQLPLQPLADYWREELGDACYS